MGLCGGRRGAAAAELAVLLPLLAFIFLITVDFGRIIYYTITIDNCVHNGALYASQTFDNQNQQWISGDAQYWEGRNSQQVSDVASAAILDGCSLDPPLTTSNVTIANGSTANSKVVTITYNFETITNFPGIPSPVTITRSCQVQVAPAVPNGT
jgi:Flp pilus assembly protein TadG